MLTLKFFANNSPDSNTNNFDNKLNITIQNERRKFSTKVSDNLESVFKLDKN
jgi:hypothetical protein